METWGSWLPADRRAALAHGGSVPDRAGGAVLVADISGFTSLTEALLDAHGPRRGAEEITVHLDRVYDALIGPVDLGGGSVIGFSGDAITCWFAGDSGTRAVLAGLAMQETMGALARIAVGAGPPVTLGVKVAIAVGPVRRFQVGRPEIQLLDVIAGPTIDAVSATEQLARRGDVALDGVTADQLAGQVRIATSRSSGGARAAIVAQVAATQASAHHGPTDLADISQEQVRPWILPHVHDQLTSGQGAFLAELRPAAALFVRFGGIDFSADDAGAMLDHYVCWAQRVIDRYEGTLLDVTIGDKGSYLAAAVGVPRTHGDITARAVNAALVLRTPPAAHHGAAQDSSRVRTLGIGISYGRMRVGAFGGRTRRSYGVQGTDMNLAARLMMRAAEGGIVISGQVAQTLGGRFDLTPTGDVRVRGIERPITTFAVDAVQSAAGGHFSTAGRYLRQPSDPGVLGREHEQNAIAASLDAAVGGPGSTGGQGSVVIIEGEAGVGKSRLLEDLFARAEDRGIRTLTGAAEAIEQATHYHAWRSVLADALGLRDAPADPADAQAWLLGRLAEFALDDESNAIDLPTLAPLLSPVLPFPITDTSATELLTGQARAETTREVLAAIIRAAAQHRPCAVVLDDCQWLDSRSWSLLSRLMAVPEPLVVVVAMRPLGEQPPPELGALLHDPRTLRLALEPLGGDAIEALVKHRLGVRTVPPQMIEVIRERGEGNPFFSEELAYALRDQGLVLVRDGRCQLAPNTPDLRQLAFPDNVEDVVRTRIDRLTPSQQTALKVASIIGRSFSVNLLRAVHPIPEQATRLEDDLIVLSRLDLTRIENAQGGPGYRFRHAITQDVAADLMLFTQRRALHRAVGEQLESMADPTGAHLSLLAHHWAAAADHDAVAPEVLDKAIEYLGDAAREAALAYANPEAASQLRRQLGLLARQPESMARDQRELSAQVTLAYSLLQLRGYGDAEVELAYRRAQELSDRVEDFGSLAFILYGLFSFYASRGEYESAEATAQRLVALSDRLGDPATRSVALQARAIVRLLRGDLTVAREAARESYDIADRLGDRAFFGFGVDFRLYTSAWLAIAELLLGEPEQAVATHAISSSAAEQQPYARAFVLGFAGIPQLLDDPAETLRASDELAQLSSRYSFALFAAIANLYRGWALAATIGDPEALGLIDGTLPVMRFVKLDSFLPWYLGLSADARLRLGRLDEALAAAEEGLALVETAGDSFYEAELHRLRSEIRATQGAPIAEVAAGLQRAIDVAQRQGARWWELRARESLARHDYAPDLDSLNELISATPSRPRIS